MSPSPRSRLRARDVHPGCLHESHPCVSRKLRRHSLEPPRRAAFANASGVPSAPGRTPRHGAAFTATTGAQRASDDVRDPRAASSSYSTSAASTTSTDRRANRPGRRPSRPRRSRGTGPRDVLRDASSRELEDVRVEVHHENLRGAGPRALPTSPSPAPISRTRFPATRDGQWETRRAGRWRRATRRHPRRRARRGNARGFHARCDRRRRRRRRGRTATDLPWPRSTAWRTAEEASLAVAVAALHLLSTRSRWRSRRDFFLFLRARASSGAPGGCRRANLGGARDERRGRVFDDAPGTTRAGAAAAPNARMHRPSPSRREHRRAGGEGDVAMHPLMDESYMRGSRSRRLSHP